MTRPDRVLEWLFERQRLGMTLGLDRVRALLDSQGSPQSAFASILVAGTNGKGSCARALAECLRESGRRTALYTSPHLSRLGERFVVDGAELSREHIAATVARLRPVSEQLGASFFEVLTVAACLLFREAQVETAVMEVGLGGRFDATNALDPELSLITGISRDHVDLLGDDPAAIAREKAGVLRPGRLAITGATGAPLAAIREVAGSLAAPLWVLGEEVGVEGRELGWQGVELSVRSPAGKASATSPLVGEHQIRNLALAAAAALVLGVEPAAVRQGLARTRWPGRLERVSHRDRWLVFDGAHNAEAAAALAKALRRLGSEPLTLVVGLGRDKDLAAFAAALGPGARRTFATRSLLSPRARPPREVAAAFGPAASYWDDPQQALGAALRAAEPGSTVVVAGSLYLVGELRPRILGEPFEGRERWQ